MGAQVQLMSENMKSLHQQVSDSNDYATDAIQQVRDELTARLDALSTTGGG